MIPVGRYIAREAKVSAAINGILSLGFGFVALGEYPDVPAWGFPGFVADSVPQGFMVGLMGALVPALLMRRAVAAGRISGIHPPIASVGKTIGFALLSAIAAAISLTALAAGFFAITGASSIPLGAALATKALTGAALGGLVTATILARLLGYVERPR